MEGNAVNFKAVPNKGFKYAENPCCAGCCVVPAPDSPWAHRPNPDSLHACKGYVAGLYTPGAALKELAANGAYDDTSDVGKTLLRARLLAQYKAGTDAINPALTQKLNGIMREAAKVPITLDLTNTDDKDASRSRPVARVKQPAPVRLPMKGVRKLVEARRKSRPARIHARLPKAVLLKRAVVMVPFNRLPGTARRVEIKAQLKAYDERNHCIRTHHVRRVCIMDDDEPSSDSSSSDDSDSV